MVVISTFVVFDIETTGLPRYEKNRTKITELTFLAVSTKDIETANIGQIPLINKLSYLFNPERIIQKEVTTLTGLSNEVLKNQLTFKNRIPSLNSFLNDLPKPVCLVAHNGNSFDFKLLRSEYKDAGADLPDNLYCVDTIWGFRKILKDSDLCYNMLTNTSNSEDLLTDDEWPEFNISAEDCDEIDQLVESFSKISTLKDSSITQATDKDKTISKKAEKPDPKSEKGPRISFIKDSGITQSTDKDKTISKKAEKPNAESEKEPKISFIKDSGITQTTDKDKTISNKVEKPVKKNEKGPKISFTLSDLYKRLLNKQAVNAHRSEADCIMLLECVIALKDQFLPYMYDKCKLISEVKPYERY